MLWKKAQVNGFNSQALIRDNGAVAGCKSLPYTPQPERSKNYLLFNFRIMGWSLGFDSYWNRDIGYGVPAICDQPDCDKKIDRGLDHVCTDYVPYGGEDGCGLYFCEKHKGEKCKHAGFKPKQDHAEWITWKLEDESWEEWRKNNPNEVKELKKQLTNPHT